MATTVVKEPKTMDQMLLEGVWNIYYVSALYKFTHDRTNLAADAADLVAFLRTSDTSGELKTHQGVNVSVRSKNDMAMFVIQEHTSESGRPAQRLGAFVYYTPSHPGQATHHITNLLLLQGNERLVAQVCHWVQHRYQCVVATNSLQIQSTCMEQFAQSIFHNISSHPEEDLVHICLDGSVLRAPLKVTLRNEQKGKLVRSVTVSIPWLDIQAKHELQRERRNTLVDQDRMIRSLFLPYCSQLAEDMSSFRLSVVSCDDCILENTGVLQLLRADRAVDVFNELLDIFVVQDVHIPETAETTL